jgi:hypothetical protein
MDLTIGHDSEFGLRHKGVVTSALDVLEREDYPEGSLFPDNLNCEIAITPVTTLKQFHSKTESLLNRVRDKGYELIMDPTILYPVNCLFHPEAMVSGCNPDYNAYTKDENEAPNFTRTNGTRSCGAHIHAGVEGLNPFAFAQWMDLLVAIPLLGVEKKTERRSMYGAAGCLRIKDYGAEYRTLSNVWLDDKSLREFVWEGTKKAVEHTKKGNNILSVAAWHEIPQAIDTHDTELADAIIDRCYIWGVNDVV